MKPVLFLDIDGVLNTCTKGMDEDKINLLKEVLSQVPCDIVLSSTWRKYPKLLDKVKKVFDLAGCTPELPLERIGSLFMGHTRGKEIKAWLDEHPEVKDFVILDDDRSVHPYEHRLVKTDSYTGITPEVAKILLSYLQSFQRD